MAFGERPSRQALGYVVHEIDVAGASVEMTASPMLRRVVPQRCSLAWRASSTCLRAVMFSLKITIPPTSPFLSYQGRISHRIHCSVPSARRKRSASARNTSPATARGDDSPSTASGIPEGPRSERRRADRGHRGHNRRANGGSRSKISHLAVKHCQCRRGVLNE